MFCRLKDFNQASTLKGLTENKKSSPEGELLNITRDWD
ncbi:hypothetical protein JCM19236_657 [Vibrio sp. JCM 19236]|nr:hypothetical protein JCM19236_657 [Vibrio sp. JCM 19236]